MTIDKKFYTNKGNEIIIKSIENSKKVPGTLSVIIEVNGNKMRNDHLNPEKLKELIDEKTATKYIKEIKKRNNFIKENNINHLYYFTNFKNLESILKNGILSRKELIRKDISYIPSDTRNNPNSNDISLSISHFNYKLLNRLSDHNRKFDTIVLVTNTKPLMMLDTEFSKNTTSYSRTERFNDIEKLFEGDRTYRDSKGLIHTLPSFYPTSPDAEALVKRHVDSKDIVKILSLSMADEYLRKYVNDLAFDYGKDYNTVNEYWPRCDQKGL